MSEAPEDLLEFARLAGIAATEADLRALPAEQRAALETIASASRARGDAATRRQPAPAADPRPAAQQAPARLATPALPPHVGLAGDVLLLAEIGRGGAGIVYRGWDPRLARVCAVKVLKDGAADGRAIERFEREARLLARLRDPYVVEVYGAGTHAGAPFIVMALVEGGTLEEALARDGPLAPRRAADLVRKVALGLAHAHAAGLVHRDVKPQNILLDALGEPRLGDFGLARDADASSLTSEGAVIGTPAYMAPEQAAHGTRATDARSDVYSLGATLYRALLGRPPHQGPSAAAIVLRILSDDPAPPRALRREVPRDLETIVLRALERDPARRYPSASALARDLERFLSGEPIEASRRSRIGVLARRAWRKHRVACLAAAALIALSAPTWALVARQQAAARRGESARAILAEVAPTTPFARRIAIAGEALEVDPRCLEAALLRGRAHATMARALGDPEALAADADLALAIDLAPDLSAPRLERARLHRALGADPRLIDDDLRAALALDPSGSVAALERGLVAIDRGDFSSAIEPLERAAAADPGNAETRALLGAARAAACDEAGAIADLDRALLLDPGCPRGLRARAAVRLRDGDPRGAFQDADLAVGLGLRDAADLVTRAAARRHLGDFRGALVDAERALSLSPDLVDADLERACALAPLGRAAESEAILDGLIASRPDLPRVRLARAHVRQLRGDVKGALADLEASYGDANPKMEVLVLRSEFRAACGDPEGALADLDLAVSAQPRVSFPLVQRARIRAGLLDLAGAREDLDRAVALEPRSPVPLEARARLRAQIGDRAGAREDVNGAIALDPRRPDGLLLRASFRVGAGELDAARDDLDAALVRDAGSGDAMLLLARIAARRKDLEAARTWTRRALEADRQVSIDAVRAVKELAGVAEEIATSR